MRRSQNISLTLLAAVSLAATACDNRPVEVRDCVDAQGHIVPDTDCREHSGGGGSGGVPYRYIYGGASGGRVGDTVVGGSPELASGARAVSEGEISRGGFGHAGEGEGGEGHGGGEGAGE